jgi:hydrogenase nickel incorporation protein HypA/HybF
MHELGIAQDILRIVCQEAESRKADKVFAVKLKMGRMFGITQDHLQDTFDLISAGTLAAGAVLEVENVQGRDFMISDIEMEIEDGRRKK